MSVFSRRRANLLVKLELLLLVLFTAVTGDEFCAVVVPAALSVSLDAFLSGSLIDTSDLLGILGTN